MKPQAALDLLYDRATQLRIDVIRATSAAGSGHPTSCMSAAELISAIFFEVMSFDIENPQSFENDRFVMSKGHAIPLLYAAYKQLGVITDDELLTLRKFDSPLEGHPTPRFYFNEAATGSLGQGLSIGLGIALAARRSRSKARTIVMMGDGEIAEGSVWEAAALASHYKLASLIGIVDMNRLAQSGEGIMGHDAETLAHRWRAFGWNTIVLNGHSIENILSAFSSIDKNADCPHMIIAQTYKGAGIDEIRDQAGYHGKPLTLHTDLYCDRLADTFRAGSAPVVIGLTPSFGLDRIRELAAVAMNDVDIDCGPIKELTVCSTRKAAGLGLAQLGAQSDHVCVLDADVKNSTYTEFFAHKYPERFFQCFIAEQNMVGIATGLQSRGLIPFAATFGAFFSRAYDQIRMAAVGRNALRLIGSHCGVSIGEDGPSQMALEDIAMIAPLPDSVILYPSDAVAAYKLTCSMAQYAGGISYMRTTRAETPVLYAVDDHFHIGGCVVVKRYEDAGATLVAAGITLHEALRAHDILAQDGLLVNVIDLYSIKPFDRSTVVDVVTSSRGRLITVEDHYRYGGMGQIVSSALINYAFTIKNLAVDQVARSGKPEELLAWAGIDAAAIVRTVRDNFSE